MFKLYYCYEGFPLEWDEETYLGTFKTLRQAKNYARKWNEEESDEEIYFAIIDTKNLELIIY